MKAAIVGPIEENYGGAEKLYDEMLENFNKFSDYDFDLIVLNMNVNNFWELIEAYYDFSNLDLQDYDLVIATKFPSWMVKAKRKFLFMQHPLRGLYDLYNSQKFTFTRNKIINNILLTLRSGKFTRANFIKIYLELIKHKNLIEDLNLAVIPGPFIREIIYFFDKVGIKECENFFAQSDNVKKRKDYFLDGTDVKVIYPPIDDKKHIPASYKNFLFTASRLHKLKRIDLLIKAFKKVKNKNINLKIAGEGSELENLKKLAKADKRIKFLGFLSDDALIKEYNNCLFVPFIPKDEDYGFITLEAMKSGKAVLTCKDSGGPLEFVKDGFNGKIARPEVNDIKNKIEELIKNRGLILKMGKNALESVKNINWKNFVKSFELESFPKNEKLEEIIALNTYSSCPPTYGGQVRVFNIYKELSKTNKITLFNLVWPGSCPAVSEINENLIEYNIPISKECEEKITKLNKNFKISINDMAFMEYHNSCHNYINILKKKCSKNKIIVCEHPFLFELVKKLPHKYIIYEAHNAEYNLKKAIFKNVKKAKPLLNKLFKCEKELCRKAKYIFTASVQDKESLVNLYKVDKKKISIIPNGVDCKRIIFTEKGEKKEYKKFLGIENNIIGIFIGSFHKPNFEAVEYIFKIAKINKKIYFFIVGSVANQYLDRKNEVPRNVIFFGTVDNFQKQILLKASDFAINPMFSGGGTNLKMFEYMAVGLPIITTEFGARGLEFDKTDFYLINKEPIKIDFNKIKNIDTQKNRKYVEVNFDWEKIAEKYNLILKGYKIK